MPHRLVVGATGCGKSRSMREKVVPKLIAAGRPVVVLDILHQEWNATYQTDDPYHFLAIMQSNTGVVGVWDECGTMLDANPELKRDLQWLATVSRNNGHEMFFLSQRLYLVPPTFRLQCDVAMLFHLRGRDVKEAEALYPGRGLETALPRLAVGECIIVRPMQRAVKTRFF